MSVDENDFDKRLLFWQKIFFWHV